MLIGLEDRARPEFVCDLCLRDSHEKASLALAAEEFRVEMVDDVILPAHRHQITELTLEGTRLPISILFDSRVVGHPTRIELEVGRTNVER